MNDARIKVRANWSTGELEVEGPSQAVEEWFGRIWPQMGQTTTPGGTQRTALPRATPSAVGNGQLPELFGEYYGEFRPALSDTEKMLVAASFVQAKDQDHTFTTKDANQLLLDQNVKVGNPSESVRRLAQAKRVFVATGGEFRVSASGFEHLESLKSKAEVSN